jgi:glycosyltransferase involved in cell wall biosynthesis
MDYLLDVMVATYNHEDYIARCIEGIVNQKTNFRFRAFIGDDASTDGTRSIIDEYAKKYPDIVYPQYREKNVGAQNNGRMLYEVATSKYLALVDGDDYWTDLNKLQKQVDILEADSGVSVVFHDCEVRYESDPAKNYFLNRDKYKLNKNVFTRYDVAKDGWFFATASLVFRNVVKPLPAWYSKIYSGDYAIMLLLVQKGDLFYLPEVMAVYTIRDKGLSENYKRDLLKFNKRKIDQFHIFYKEFGTDKKLRKSFKAFIINNMKKRLRLLRNRGMRWQYALQTLKLYLTMALK